MIKVLRSWQDVGSATLALQHEGVTLDGRQPIPDCEQPVVRWQGRDYTFVQRLFGKVLA